MKLFDCIKAFWERNDTKILTAVAITGTVVTPILASKATLKAKEVLDEYSDDEKPWHKDLETWKKMAKIYAPAVASGMVTGGSIIFCDKIHVEKELALGTLASLWEARHANVLTAIEEKYGKEEADKMFEENSAKLRPKGGDLKAVASEGVTVYDEISETEIKKLDYSRVAYANYILNDALQHGKKVSWHDIIVTLGGVPNKRCSHLIYDPKNIEICWANGKPFWVDIFIASNNCPGNSGTYKLAASYKPRPIS